MIIKHSKSISSTSIKTKQCKGFSLVEFMVAIVIALFLLAAVIGSVYSINSSHLTQRGMSKLLDEQRFALTILDNTVSLAGYFPNPLTNNSSQALPTSMPFAVDVGIAGVSNAPGTSGDTLYIRYQTVSGDPTPDCSGQSNTSGINAIIINQYYVSNEQLFCQATNGLKTATTNKLVDGVTNMTVLYGVDSNGDASVDTYKSASAISNTDWANVLSVQITLTFKDTVSSVSGSGTTAPLTHTINLLNKS